MSIFKDILLTLRGGITVTTPSAYVQAQKKLAAAGDYAAEDVLSENATDTAGTAFEFKRVARSKGGAFSVTQAVALCSTTNLTPRLTLYLFSKTPSSELDDNAANSAVAALDVDFYLGRIEFPAMSDLGGQSEAIAMMDTGSNLPLDGVCSPGLDSIYGIAVTEDAITGEVAGMTLTFKLFVRQD